jgi:hypothetical protein
LGLCKKFNKGKFVFYNRTGDQSNKDRIKGSILEFKLNGSVTDDFKFNTGDDVIRFETNKEYNEVVIGFSYDYQNWKNIEIIALPTKGMCSL